MKFFKECNNGLHQFEPRYDKSPADMRSFKSFKGTGAASLEFAEKHRSVTYVRDVCVRCGKTIERHSDGIDPGLMAVIDKWRLNQPDSPSPDEAIRRLVNFAIEHDGCDGG